MLDEIHCQADLDKRFVNIIKGFMQN